MNAPTSESTSGLGFEVDRDHVGWLTFDRPDSSVNTLTPLLMQELDALLSQLEIHLPGRPAGAPEEVVQLRERDDVNVLFVLIDTLRADHLSAYGYERETTPRITELLAQRGLNHLEVMDHRAHVHLGDAAAGHDVDLVAHPGQGEDGVEVFHFHHFVNQES